VGGQVDQTAAGGLEQSPYFSQHQLHVEVPEGSVADHTVNFRLHHLADLFSFAAVKLYSIGGDPLLRVGEHGRREVNGDDPRGCITQLPQDGFGDDAAATGEIDDGHVGGEFRALHQIAGTFPVELL